MSLFILLHLTSSFVFVIITTATWRCCLTYGRNKLLSQSTYWVFWWRWPAALDNVKRRSYIHILNIARYLISCVIVCKIQVQKLKDKTSVDAFAHFCSFTPKKRTKIYWTVKLATFFTLEQNIIDSSVHFGSELLLVRSESITWPGGRAWIFTAVMKLAAALSGEQVGEDRCTLCDHIKTSFFWCFTTQMGIKTYSLKPCWISALRLSLNAASCHNEQHSHLWAEDRLQSVQRAELQPTWMHPQNVSGWTVFTQSPVFMASVSAVEKRRYSFFLQNPLSGFSPLFLSHMLPPPPFLPPLSISTLHLCLYIIYYIIEQSPLTKWLC